MRVVGHNALGQPIDVELTRLVVYDVAGNPIILAMHDTPRSVLCATAADPDYHALRKIMGIDRTVVITDAQLSQL